MFLLLAESETGESHRCHLFYVFKLSLQFVGVLIIYSRIAEMDYEIKYGEKKDLSQWASRANLLDRSGVNTPAARTPGTRTPVG